MKIAVYTMAKNEVDHVARFAETTKEADVVVVTDTGSTDGTQSALRDHGITVCEARIMPWRFDHGSNAALFNVPDDVDVCVKLDLDEVLYMTDGTSWRAEIERMWKEDTTQLNYWYTWSWIEKGVTPAVRFRTAHIHKREGYHWRHPGHAALTNMLGNSEIVRTDKLEIHHYMVSKGRPDYVHLLELAVKECRCPRTLYYLGREYFHRNKPKEAINVLMDYLEHPEATWDSERSNALRIIGLCWEQYREYDRAVSFLVRSISEFPKCRELWYELGRFFHDREDWEGAIWALKKALSFTERNPNWIGNVRNAWTDKPKNLLVTAEQKK